MDLIESWRGSGTCMNWRGHQVFVRISGAGSPVLLIHGFPTSSLDWHRIEPELALRHRTVCFDLLGFGFSDKPAEHDYRIVEQANLAEAVLAHFGVVEAAVLAHDYGDTVAQELLARQVDGTATFRMTRLGLLNGGLFPETHRPRLVQRLLASPLGPWVARLIRYPRFAASMRAICVQPFDESELRAMWAMIEIGDGRRAMPRLIRYMAERREYRERWVGALRRSSIPIRLINGIADPISGAHMVARYRKLVSTHGIVELPGVGHYPQLEAPEQVLDAWMATPTVAA